MTDINNLNRYRVPCYSSRSLLSVRSHQATICSVLSDYLILLAIVSYLISIEHSPSVITTIKICHAIQIHYMRPLNKTKKNDLPLWELINEKKKMPLRAL